MGESYWDNEDIYQPIWVRLGIHHRVWFDHWVSDRDNRWSCLRCGALVKESLVQVHENFHDNYIERILA